MLQIASRPAHALVGNGTKLRASTRTSLTPSDGRGQSARTAHPVVQRVQNISGNQEISAMRYLTREELQAELGLAASAILAKRPHKPKKTYVQGETKRYVYVMGLGGALVKIGIATDVRRRRKQLQTGQAKQLKVHHKILCPLGMERDIEAACHQALRGHRQRGEWFSVEPDYAVAVLDDVFRRLTKT